MSDQTQMFEEAPAQVATEPATDAEYYEAGRAAERVVRDAFYAKMRELASLLGFTLKYDEGHETYSWVQPVELHDPRHEGRGYRVRQDKNKIQIHGILSSDQANHLRHGGDHADEHLTIGLNASRSAKDIAGEIYNRLYTPYLDLRRVLEERHAAQEQDNNRKREIGRQIAAAGGPGAEYKEDEDGRTMIKVRVFNGHKRAYGDSPRAEAEISTYNHERVTMKLTDLPVELAARIMQTMGEYTRIA